MYNTIKNLKEVFNLKKTIALIIAVLLIFSTVFVACSNKENDNNNNDETDLSNTGEQQTGGITTPEDEYGFEEDEKGNTVPVKYTKDKNGNIIANVIDEQGNMTDVTVPVHNYLPEESTSYKNPPTIANNTTSNPAEDETVTNNTSNEKGTTSPELTTIKMKNVKVPKTTDEGKPVQFSDRDILMLTKLLQVPYLYTASYENKDGVPISIARHAAIWMVQNDGSTNTTFPQGTILLDLFTYFDDTVKNFSTECNTAPTNTAPAPIRYNQSNNIFTITSYESKTHSINIKEIQNLGNNNYYKVIADVSEENESGCNVKKLVAVVQKNKLNSKYRYSFSVKALQWS